MLQLMMMMRMAVTGRSGTAVVLVVVLVAARPTDWPSTWRTALSSTGVVVEAFSAHDHSWGGGALLLRGYYWC